LLRDEVTVGAGAHVDVAARGDACVRDPRPRDERGRGERENRCRTNETGVSTEASVGVAHGRSLEQRAHHIEHQACFPE
jgi:hypothetical protein